MSKEREIIEEGEYPEVIKMISKEIIYLYDVDNLNQAYNLFYSALMDREVQEKILDTVSEFIQEG